MYSKEDNRRGKKQKSETKPQKRDQIYSHLLIYIKNRKKTITHTHTQTLKLYPEQNKTKQKKNIPTHTKNQNTEAFLLFPTYWITVI